MRRCFLRSRAWTRCRGIIGRTIARPSPRTEEISARCDLSWRATRAILAQTHFYIHAVEAGPNPEDGLPAADRLRNTRLPPGIWSICWADLRACRPVSRCGAGHGTRRSKRIAIHQPMAAHWGFYPGVIIRTICIFFGGRELFSKAAARRATHGDEAATYAVDNYCGPKKALQAPRLRHLPW